MAPEDQELFGRLAVLALLPIFVGEVGYSGLANIQVYSAIEQVIGQWLPWVELVCILTLAVSLVALASTWWARDWWVERWARSHESFVG